MINIHFSFVFNFPWALYQSTFVIHKHTIFNSKTSTSLCQYFHNNSYFGRFLTATIYSKRPICDHESQHAFLMNSFDKVRLLVLTIRSVSSNEDVQKVRKSYQPTHTQVGASIISRCRKTNYFYEVVVKFYLD